MKMWQSMTLLLILSTSSVFANAQAAADTEPKPLPEASRGSSVQYQSGESLSSYQTGPDFFVSARLGLLQSFDTQIQGLLGRQSFDDAFTGSAAGLRAGLLLGKWRTWLEINPAFAASKDDAEVEAKSLTLATDYAVWQSDNAKQQFSIGAFASNLSVRYTVNENGDSFSKPTEASGLSYGLQIGYRIDFTQHLFAGIDLQYALNGVQGRGDGNTVGGLRVDNYALGNLELGFKF